MSRDRPVRPRDSVWVAGRRFGAYYLMSLETGRVLRTVRVDKPVMTAGWGKRCAGHFAAVFLDPVDEQVKFQAGRMRFSLDDTRTELSARVVLGGTMTVLHVMHPDVGKVVLRDFTLWRALASRFDPTYDTLDESADDFLSDVAGVVFDPEGRNNMRERADPFADPTAAHD